MRKTSFSIILLLTTHQAMQWTDVLISADLEKNIEICFLLPFSQAVSRESSKPAILTWISATFPANGLERPQVLAKGKTRSAQQALPGSIHI